MNENEVKEWLSALADATLFSNSGIDMERLATNFVAGTLFFNPTYGGKKYDNVFDKHFFEAPEA